MSGSQEALFDVGEPAKRFPETTRWFWAMSVETDVQEVHRSPGVQTRTSSTRL